MLPSLCKAMVMCARSKTNAGVSVQMVRTQRSNAKNAALAAWYTISPTSRVADGAVGLGRESPACKLKFALWDEIRTSGDKKKGWRSYHSAYKCPYVAHYVKDKAARENTPSSEVDSLLEKVPADRLFPTGA